MDDKVRFNAIFDRAALGFAFINSKTGELIKVNQKFCDIVGFTTATDSMTTFMAITHPDDLQEDLDNMQKMLQGKIREFTMRKRYIRKNGSIVWVNLTVSALWDVGHQPDFHLAVVEDISVRKSLEDKLLQLNNLLDQRVLRRTAKLKKTMQEIVEKNRQLEQNKLELVDANHDLEELNTTLRVLLEQTKEGLKEFEEQLIASMQLLVEPYLSQLARICVDSRQKNYIELIKANLKEVISPFSRKLSSGYANFTATEIRVADLIAKSHTNKEIAEKLNISPKTVAFHRKNIRRKLGIMHTKKNLAYYLGTIK